MTETVLLETSFSYTPQTFCKFVPAEDITAYELALIIAAAQLAMWPQKVFDLPERAQRHFEGFQK